MSLNKKYGVIWHKPQSPSDDNIGDDIQTLAAIELLRKNNIFEYSLIERESIHTYDGEPITLIMNGWWAHGNQQIFPLPDQITPVFISFHCASRPHVIVNNFEYFKKHEPIGCRDQATVDFLSENGVEAYFTGCLTLAFDTYEGMYDTVRKGEYVVDDTWLEPRVREHYKKYTDNWIHVAHKGLLSDATKSSDPIARLEMARHILQCYKHAENIITSRLHCALPAIAMGASVIFNHYGQDKDCRFTGLQDILQNDDKVQRAAAVQKIKSFFNELKI